ncbi:MAG: CoA transferase [Chloroflexi bacterium]|nr:CoA transferase [Chloroflexota bacterium]
MTDASTIRNEAAGITLTGPLAGTRGIVLTQAWAGSYCTALLGMLGADVIQVEVRKRPDSWRGDYAAPIGGRIKDVETAVHPWNVNPLYNSVNLNKRCITLDLGTPEGIEIYRRLVPYSDFIAENFSPRVMGNFGLEYEALKAIKPDIILASLSAYGHIGSWANIPGIGGTIEPTSGLSGLLGYEGGPPMNSGQMYPDAVAAFNAFGAIIAALRHRDLTGEGQYIDLSMQDANLAMIGDSALEYVLTGRQRARLGNRHSTYAPHGIYAATGTERWIALATETDAQWAALCSIAGRGWAEDNRFVTNADRKANEDALDAEIAAWTATEDRDALSARLSAAGIYAAPVLDGLEVADDPHLRARGVVREVKHPEAGTWAQATIPLHFSRTPATDVRAAPMQGEHTRQVLAELLGMTDAEVDELERSGVSGMGPPD